MKEKISSKNHLILQYFLLDLLAHLSYKCQEIQKQYTTVITGKKLIDKLLAGTAELNYKVGEHLTWFLKEVKYQEKSQIDTWKSVEIVEKFIQPMETKLKLKEYYLSEENYLTEFKFPQIRKALVDRVVENLKSYFEDDLKIYAFVEPINLPEEVSQIESYGKSDLLKICMKFKSTYKDWDCETIQNDFESILKILVPLESYQRERIDDIPETFWPNMLTLRGTDFSTQMRTLIYAVLTLPLSSSTAERGFSILKHVQMTRYRLGEKHVESLMRIKINGPNQLEMLNFLSYAKILKKDLKASNRITEHNIVLGSEEYGHNPLLKDSIIF